MSPTCSLATNPPRSKPEGVRWKPLLALPIILILAACAGPDADAEFNGTVLRNQNAEVAPDFTLTNQSGQPASMADFRGSVVVLTFLYTNCPDVCPIVTSQLREAEELLELDANEARFIAVSVDPDRDTVQSARDYLDKWKLSENWHFLVGERPALEEVWKNYYIDPAVTDHDPLESSQASPTPKPGGALNALSAEITQRYLVVHSTPVYLIGRDGRRRVVFTPPLEPEKVAADIQKLLDAR